MTDLVMHTSADTAAAFLANADKDLFSVFVVRVTKSTPTFKHVKSADVEEADPRYASRLGGMWLVGSWNEVTWRLPLRRGDRR